MSILPWAALTIEAGHPGKGWRSHPLNFKGKCSLEQREIAEPRGMDRSRKIGIQVYSESGGTVTERQTGFFDPIFAQAAAKQKAKNPVYGL
ncbi:hypothetical protein NG791_17960 [Laspinema sp. D1]|uniref:hypothetical protein n=1 Tax=Laspinema palackyanum TaxID=3231601 RepID=UPI00347FCE68|nr:hypothetical protein [Laspinema sp. D2b]